MLARLLFLLVTIISSTMSSKVNPLNGQLLRVLAQEFPVSLSIQRNATGHVIHCDGIEKHMIEALSQILNFTYFYLPDNPMFRDDSPSGRGGISYLVTDEADYYLSTTLANPFRIKIADFPACWIFYPFSTLLPYPKSTLNLAAAFGPFSYEVWIFVTISAFVTALYLTKVFRKKSFQANGSYGGNKEKSSGDDWSSGSVVTYVVGNLVSQGQRDFPKRLAIRIAAGAWCCGCFFLVQIYCSTLTSHLTSPNQKPIINSFFEIADTSGVSLVIDRGQAIDATLKITESTNLKRFADTLKKENRLITCNISSDCLDYVRNGNSVYAAPPNSLSILMAADMKRTGTCQFTKTKETFWKSSAAFTLLRKNSPYTESMSRGILRLRDSGLIGEWEKWYVPSVSKCMKLNERIETPRLSMKHLSSAFVILAGGCLLSMFVFVMEKLIRFQRALHVEVV